MSDLKVDYETLETSADTVGRLKGTFDALPNRVAGQQSDWGDRGIADAMDDFANNWDYRRDILSGKLAEVHEKIESTLETFRKADAKLASELDKAMHGDEGGS